MKPSVVVKVGGSLFDVPDLGCRLRDLLASFGAGPVVLVPGGGPTTDVVRALDRRNGLGEEACHWLALRALRLNAYLLQSLLGSAAAVVESPDQSPTVWGRGQTAVLDAFAFAQADDGRPGCLPHSWGTTSDALAARLAVVLRARQLILLKSADPPENASWAEAGRRGYVDPVFAGLLANQAPGLPWPLEVLAVNFRRWAAGARRGRPASTALLETGPDGPDRKK